MEQGKQEWGKGGMRFFRESGERQIDPIAAAAGVISEELVVGRSLFLKRETVLPGAKGVPHYHSTTSIIIMLRGRVRVNYGPAMEFVDYAQAGEFITIPPEMPHQPVNESMTTPMECFVIRDAAEEEVIPFVTSKPEPVTV